MFLHRLHVCVEVLYHVNFVLCAVSLYEMLPSSRRYFIQRIFTITYVHTDLSMILET
jgi:hypothetical protein